MNTVFYEFRNTAVEGSNVSACAVAHAGALWKSFYVELKIIQFVTKTERSLGKWIIQGQDEVKRD